MLTAQAEESAGDVVLGLIQAGLDAIKRGDVELGSSLIEGVRAHVAEPTLLDTWKALALIEAGKPRDALVTLADGGPDFGWVRDRREATQALAMRTLEMPGWQRLAERILSASQDPIARSMASRVEAWH